MSDGFLSSARPLVMVQSPRAKKTTPQVSATPTSSKQVGFVTVSSQEGPAAEKTLSYEYSDPDTPEVTFTSLSSSEEAEFSAPVEEEEAPTPLIVRGSEDSAKAPEMSRPYSQRVAVSPSTAPKPATGTWQRSQPVSSAPQQTVHVVGPQTVRTHTATTHVQPAVKSTPSSATNGVVGKVGEPLTMQVKLPGAGDGVVQPVATIQPAPPMATIQPAPGGRPQYSSVAEAMRAAKAKTGQSPAPPPTGIQPVSNNPTARPMSVQPTPQPQQAQPKPQTYQPQPQPVQLKPQPPQQQLPQTQTPQSQSQPAQSKPVSPQPAQPPTAQLQHNPVPVQPVQQVQMQAVPQQQILSHSVQPQSAQQQAVINQVTTPRPVTTVHQVAGPRPVASPVQQPTLFAQQPTVLAQQPVMLVQQPAMVVQQATPLAQQPTPLAQQPTPLAQQPTPQAQQPTPLTQQPTALSQQPTALAPQPTALAQQPTPQLNLALNSGSITPVVPLLTQPPAEDQPIQPVLHQRVENRPPPSMLSGETPDPHSHSTVTPVSAAKSLESTPHKAPEEMPFSLEQFLNSLSSLPLQTLVYFVGLIFGTALVAMIADLSPTWMIVILAIASVALFHKLSV